jgi:hypothetical protein
MSKALFVLFLLLDFVFYGIVGFLLSGIAMNLQSSYVIGFVSGVAGTAADIYVNRGKFYLFTNTEG